MSTHDSLTGQFGGMQMGATRQQGSTGGDLRGGGGSRIPDERTPLHIEDVALRIAALQASELSTLVRELRNHGIYLQVNIV